MRRRWPTPAVSAAAGGAGLRSSSPPPTWSGPRTPPSPASAPRRERPGPPAVTSAQPASGGIAADGYVQIYSPKHRCWPSWARSCPPEGHRASPDRVLGPGAAVDPDVPHGHGGPRGGGGAGGGAVTGAVRVFAADGEVQDDREAVVHGPRPRLGADLALVHGEEQAPVEIPADLLVRDVAPVDDDGVGVIAALASGARPQAAAQAGVFVARPGGAVGVADGEVSAVQGGGMLAARVDVFHDVDLAGARPGAGAEHPERGPVPQAAGRVRLLDRSGHHQLAPGRGGEGTAVGLDPGRGPGLILTDRRDVQATVAGEADVARCAGHGGDIAVAEGTRAADVELPATRGLSGGTGEVVAPDQGPADRARAPGGKRDRDGHHDHHYHQADGHDQEAPGEA